MGGYGTPLDLLVGTETGPQQGLAQRPAPEPIPVPLDQLAHFRPATHYVYEWRTYEFECGDADCVMVGHGTPFVVRHGHAVIQFGNQLGATTLRFLRGGRPVQEPLHIEVISHKLTDLDGRVGFLRCLLDDLYTRAARLPFTFSADTSRSTDESLRPPSCPSAALVAVPDSFSAHRREPRSGPPSRPASPACHSTGLCGREWRAWTSGSSTQSNSPSSRPTSTPPPPCGSSGRPAGRRRGVEGEHPQQMVRQEVC